MAVRIISPEFSFVQFSPINSFTDTGNNYEDNIVSDCLIPDTYEVLPVVLDNDIWYQFILETDTKEEADELCADTGTIVRVGLSRAYNCTSDIMQFDEIPERSRIDETHVLYNWMHGMPGFTAVIEVGDCITFYVNVTGGPVIDNNFVFCSNPFKRYDETCFTVVAEFGNDVNFADYIYCPGAILNAGDCTPVEISFSDESNLNIPYTTSLQERFGDVPTVQVWVYDGDGHLVISSAIPQLDTFPPTLITIDLGGTFTGIVKIS